MKKLKLTAILLAAGTMAFAQPDDKKKSEDVEIQINGGELRVWAEDLAKLSTVDLNKIVAETSRYTAKVQKQTDELRRDVDELERSGVISKAEAEELRLEIGRRQTASIMAIGEMLEAQSESYEERMETWAEAYESQIEAWEDEMEARAERGDKSKMAPLPPVPPVPQPEEGERKSGRRITIDEEGISISRGKDGEKPYAWKFENDDADSDDEDDNDNNDSPSRKSKKIDPTEAYFDINFGFNQQLPGGEELITDGPEELKFWKSTEFNMGLGGKTRIGSPYSKLYIKYGGEFSWHAFRLQNDNILLRTDPDTVKIITDPDGDYSKTKYAIAYFNIPLMLQLDFSEVGERDDAFTLGVGGYGGVRLRAKTEQEFTNDILGDAEREVKNDYNTSQFRYGLMAQVGFGNFKITGKYDLNPFFKDGEGPDYQMASVTVGFSW